MNYLKRTSGGSIHIGATIRAYLESNGIQSSTIAKKIGVTRGGMAHIFKKPHIVTDRLEQISRATGHNFFKYYIPEAMESERRQMLVGEPIETYHSEAPKRTKVVLELENGKVISHATSDSHLLDKLIEQQERQWEMLQTIVKQVGVEMATDPTRNPANMPKDEPLAGSRTLKKRQRGPNRPPTESENT